MNGDHRDAIERVITKLYSGETDDVIAKNIDIFWDEYKHFQKQTGLGFEHPSRWLTNDALSGRSFLWHEKVCCDKH